VIADLPARRVNSRRAERIFYVGMSLAVIAMVLAGFAKTYFLRSYFVTTPLPLTTRIHGAAFTAWVLLFLAQSTLVAAHRTDIHRKLGWIGAALAVFMTGIAVRTAINAVHAAVVCCNADLARGFLIIPIADAIVFGVLVGYAVVNRRDTGTHKRLMLLATLAILDAATGRWPWSFIQAAPYNYVVALDVIILAIVAYDTIARKHLARAYAWGVPLVVGSHVARELIRASPTWKSFVTLFVG
jgi:hypothetical protein